MSRDERGPGIGRLTATLSYMTEGQIEILVRVADVLQRQPRAMIDGFLEAPVIVMMPAPEPSSRDARRMRGMSEPYLSIRTLRGRGL